MSDTRRPVTDDERRAMEHGKTVELRRNGELIAVIQQADGQRGFSVAQVLNGSDGAEYELSVLP